MRTLNFCIGALAINNGPEKQDLIEDMRALAIDSEEMTDEKYSLAINEYESILTSEQLDFLNAIRKRDMLLPDDIMSLDSTGFNVIDGLSANLITGQLGLIDPKALPQIRV